MSGIELLGVGVELIPSTGQDDDLVIGSSVVSGGTTGRILYDNSGLLGQYPITGSGSVALIAGALVVANGKTATISNTLTFTGTDGSTLNIGTGGTLGTGAFAPAGITALTGDVTASGSGSVAATLTTAQPAVHTWALAQTFTTAPVFTDQSGSRTALGLGTSAIVNTGTSGATIPLLNGANTWSAAQVFSSTILYQALVSAQAATPVSVSSAASGTVFTNEGASALGVFNLPTAVANLVYTFVVEDSDGIKIVANTGDTIRISASVSASAGNATSTVIGSTVTLVAINATEWVSIATNGTWIVT